MLSPFFFTICFPLNLEGGWEFAKPTRNKSLEKEEKVTIENYWLISFQEFHNLGLFLRVSIDNMHNKSLCDL